ncbi:MAG: hypothetical protein WC876_03115 [Candidatus Thermoplasmatota archaeon]
MRQERAAAQRRKALPAKAGKRLLIVAIVVVAIAGVVYAFQQSAETRRECPGHWHATFQIFVEGERVPFPQPPYLMAPQGKLPMSLHMHTPSQEILHFEPAQPECLGTKDTFEIVDVDLGATKMTIGDDHGPLAGSYENDGNKTLRYFVQVRDGEMEETTWSKLGGRQLANGEKLLIAYGQYTEAQIKAMMGGISTPP